MLRKLLGLVAALGLPAVLVGQAPAPANPAAGLARPHGVAMQVQGEVVAPVDQPAGVETQEGVDEANGDNNDGDVENGDLEQEGVDEPDGLNNEVEVGDQVDQSGDNQTETEGGDTPAPPAGTAQIGQIGRHRP